MTVLQRCCLRLFLPGPGDGQFAAKHGGRGAHPGLHDGRRNLSGITCGAAAVALAGRTSDHLVQATLTAVAAYGSFLLAENLQFSGVLATVAAGLLMGNLGVQGR